MGGGSPDNRRGQSALWSLGISGDDPLLLLEIHNAADASRAEPYMRLHRSLRLGGVTTELALAYREEPVRHPAAGCHPGSRRSALCESLLGVQGGIHPVNLTIHGEEALTPAHRPWPPTTVPGICSGLPRRRPITVRFPFCR